MSKVQTVSDYMKQRKQVSLEKEPSDEQVCQLASYFGNGGSLKDLEGHLYTDFDALVKYFKRPTPTATIKEEPKQLPNGQVTCTFTVTKGLTKTIEAVFTFSDTSNLFKSIVLYDKGLSLW
jgi:hypothetical protein